MNSDPQDTTAFAREIGQQFSALAAQARPAMAAEVNNIVAQADTDARRIEYCLDALLDYGFDDKVLTLFKQLCRYYYTVNPAATAQYIHFYREMWDSSDGGWVAPKRHDTEHREPIPFFSEANHVSSD